MIRAIKRRSSAKESFEGQESAYASIMGADSQLDELILYYNSLIEINPAWRDMLETMISQLMEHKGRFTAMRDSLLSEDNREALTQGEEIGLAELSPDVYAPQFSIPSVSEDAIAALILTDPIASCEDVEDEIASEDEAAATDVPSEEEDFIVLMKESDDPEEAFLEYHYTEWFQAQSSFFSATSPAALLAKDERGMWGMAAVSPECMEDNLFDILAEQIDLLNAQDSD